MASTIVKLKNRPTKKGECSLFLFVFHKGNKAEFSLQIKVLPEYWDNDRKMVKRKHPRAGILNGTIKRRVAVFENLIAQFELSKPDYSIKDIKEGVRQLKQPYKVDSRKVLDVLSDYVENNPENLQRTTLANYSSFIQCMKEYDQELRFDQLDTDFCYKYEKYLKLQGKAVNTIWGRMKTLRKAVSIAISKGILPNNPMAEYKKKSEESRREYLTIDELKLLESYEAEFAAKQKVLDLFLFMCYTGLRFSDICTLTQDEVVTENEVTKLHFKMDKGNEYLGIKLSSKPLKILKKYWELNLMYGFGILNESKDLQDKYSVKKEISRRNAYYNKSIKPIAKAVELEKNVSMHIGRHTFATISLSLGVPIEVVSKLLGHKSIKETQIYAKILDQSKDKAIDLWDKI